MDTHTLRPQSADVIAANASHRPHHKNSSSATAIPTGTSGHTTPQSDLSSTDDGDDTPLRSKMLPNSISTTPTPVVNKPHDNKPSSKSSHYPNFKPTPSYEQILNQNPHLRKLYPDHQRREVRMLQDRFFLQHLEQPSRSLPIHNQQHHKSRSSVVVVPAAPPHHSQPKKVKSNSSTTVAAAAVSKRCIPPPSHSSSPPLAKTTVAHKPALHHVKHSPLQLLQSKRQQKLHKQEKLKEKQDLQEKERQKLKQETGLDVNAENDMQMEMERETGKETEKDMEAEMEMEIEQKKMTKKETEKEKKMLKQKELELELKVRKEKEKNDQQSELMPDQRLKINGIRNCNSNRRTLRIPPRLVPSWLPASALDWTEDDDNDDADIYRHIYLRLKTDEEMEECARVRQMSLAATGGTGNSKHKKYNQNHQHSSNGGNGVTNGGTLQMSLSTPPAATTRSRKQADEAASVRRSDNVVGNIVGNVNNGINNTNHHPNLNGIRDRTLTNNNAYSKGGASTSAGLVMMTTPTVSTRKRSRAAAQLDSGSREEHNGRNIKISPGTSGSHHGRNNSSAQNNSGGGSSGNGNGNGNGHHHHHNNNSNNNNHHHHHHHQGHQQNQHHYGNQNIHGKASQMRGNVGDHHDINRQNNTNGNATVNAQSHKKVRQAHGSSHGRPHASRDQFVKHESRKGWLVCKKCRASVWPPNIGKHDSTCPGQ